VKEGGKLREKRIVTPFAFTGKSIEAKKKKFIYKIGFFFIERLFFLLRLEIYRLKRPFLN